MIYGTDSALHLEKMPLLRRDTTIQYEGSIDKEGINNDFTWALYHDKNGEWVLLDVEGPGCIYNFVQHRYPQSPEVTFRFYFDHEETPRLEIKNTEFGEKYPFLEPVASRFIGSGPNHNPVIRVVRSYVPMPFAKACKVTSSLKLEGNRVPDGGWGHIVYQKYSSDEKIETFSAVPVPEEPYQPLYELWKRAGFDPFPAVKKTKHHVPGFVLKPREKKTIYHCDHAAAVIGIRIHAADFERSDLVGLSIAAKWDGVAAVDANFGCFFHNELGYHPTSYLLAQMGADGEYANYYPMPFAKSGEIEIINHTEREIVFDGCDVADTEEFNSLYREGEFGYFTSTPYYTKKHTEGADNIIAQISGSGHVAGVVITASGRTPDDRASCEGNVRVHIDGKRTPQVESDGSESYVCYGWGFKFPPSCHPSAGYDGIRYQCENEWSMARMCIGDCYPFNSSLRFGIQSAGCNDEYMNHSGMVFYYDSRKGIIEEQIQQIETGSKALTSVFEGDDDDTLVTMKGDYGKTVSFDTELPENNHTLSIHRISDQFKARQRAKVLVDGVACPTDWVFADSNLHQRWLEDEYVLPASVLTGKNQVHIDLVPVAAEEGEEVTWNVFGLTVHAIR